mmetsp:Transcript_2265/g.5008  ORF Transcript_2265/g.5008 Transcript_2265/m.5008 type:complete len:202 (-) Transcript_2265:99-704(-)
MELPAGRRVAALPAVGVDVPGLGHLEAAQRVDQGGLPDPRRPDKGHRLSGSQPGCQKIFGLGRVAGVEADHRDRTPGDRSRLLEVVVEEPRGAVSVVAKVKAVVVVQVEIIVVVQVVVRGVVVVVEVIVRVRFQQVFLGQDDDRGHVDRLQCDGNVPLQPGYVEVLVAGGNHKDGVEVGRDQLGSAGVPPGGLALDHREAI